MPNLLDNNMRSQLKKKAHALKRALKEQCIAEKRESELLNTSRALLEDPSCPGQKEQKADSRRIKYVNNRKCNLFLLLAKFKQHCQMKLKEELNLRVLLELMECYQKIIKPAVCSFYTSSKDASKLKSEVSKKHMFYMSKLKSEMSRMHMFFHMYYSVINTAIDRALYLEIMSDLMSMYIDMEILEIEASCTKTENIKKIASIITSSFMVLFGNNADNYILDCLLKTHVPTRPSPLFDLIFRGILRSVPEHFIDALSYIRYLLVFRLWESIVETKQLKNNIKKISILLLKPPTRFREQVYEVDSLQRILPTIPEGFEDNNITAFLVDCEFSLNEAIKNYFITSDTKEFLYTGRIVPNSPIGLTKKVEILDVGDDDNYLVQTDCFNVDKVDKIDDDTLSAWEVSDLSLCEMQTEENFELPPVLLDEMESDCLPCSTERVSWSILAYLRETSQSLSSSTNRGQPYSPVECFNLSPNKAETVPLSDEERVVPSSSTDIVLAYSNTIATEEIPSQSSQLIMNDNLVSSSSDNKIFKKDNHNKFDPLVKNVVPKEASKRKLNKPRPALRKSPRLKGK